MLMNEDYLCHHGVKGMKWGRRKQRVSSGTRKTTTSSSKKTTPKPRNDISSNEAAELNKALAKYYEKQIRKQKVKKIAKTAAVIAGGIAVTGLLGNIGAQIWTNGYILRNDPNKYLTPYGLVRR